MDIERLRTCTNAWSNPQLKNSGVFNVWHLFRHCAPRIGVPTRPLRFASWNCRSLLQAGGQKSSLKKHYLSRLRLQETVVALQE
eukprot:2645995-Pyramimonas_sp.AAC.1